jgi:beta-aspartyl-dipeptidase (metallo-type)
MNFPSIEQGEVYTTHSIGTQSSLLIGNQIAQTGPLDREQLRAFDAALTTVDASHCVVVPGLIDPPAHLSGAGGEEGFASRMPEILLSPLVCAGVPLLLGLLGTDTRTRHLSCLHAKAAPLGDEGLTAYMYTGGFEHLLAWDRPRIRNGRLIAHSKTRVGWS